VRINLYLDDMVMVYSVLCTKFDDHLGRVSESRTQLLFNERMCSSGGEVPSPAPVTLIVYAFEKSEVCAL
jgi:hypothetical protein